MKKGNAGTVQQRDAGKNRKVSLLSSSTAYLGKIILVAVVYYLSGRVGLLFSIFKGNIALINPPSGIALAGLLIFGWEYLPGVVLGAFATTISNGTPLSYTLITVVGNSLAALVPALLIGRGKKFTCLNLDRTDTVATLIIFGMLLGPLISASIGSLGILLSGMGTTTGLMNVWAGWWLGDAMGVLVFTPFFLVWLGKPLPALKTPRYLATIVIFSLLILLELMIFSGRVPPENAYQLMFLIFPLAIWAALRLDIRSIPTINLLVIGLNVWGITRGLGSFGDSSLTSILIYLGMNSILFMPSLLLAAAIEERRAMENMLSMLSTHDSLTGLYNRLFYETEMERLSKSRQYPISLIMADVDEFKKVNDSLGHQKGDQVLKNVAALFTRVFRQDDIVARQGGDEFVVLLPSTDETALRKILKRIREQIEVFNRKHVDLPIHISIGASTAQQGQALNEHLNNADQLMYAEKQLKSITNKANLRTRPILE